MTFIQIMHISNMSSSWVWIDELLMGFFLLHQAWEAGEAGETGRKQFCLQKLSFWVWIFFVCVLFFTQKLFFEFHPESGFCMWVHFLPSVDFGLQRGVLEELRQCFWYCPPSAAPALLQVALGGRRISWLFRDCFRRGPVYLSAASADQPIKG